MSKHIKIFCCYSHADEELLNKLKKHLQPLLRVGLIELWCDTDIGPGTQWKAEIHKHLANAHIVLLLISADFIASEYCYSQEMRQAMELHATGQTTVVPIILRPVHWSLTALKELQALPTNAIPVVSARWSSQDEAFLDITEGLRRLVEELMNEDVSVSQDDRSPVQRAFSSQSLVSAATTAGNVPPVISRAVQALDSSVREERLEAIDILAQANHPVAREALATALEHVLRDVRIHTALSVSSDKRAIPSLIEALYDSDKKIYEPALKALRKLGRIALPALLEELKSENSWVRSSVLDVVRDFLGRAKDKETLQSIANALSDVHPTVFTGHAIFEEILSKAKEGNEVFLALLIETLPDIVRQDGDVRYKLIKAFIDILRKHRDARIVTLLISVLPDVHEQEIREDDWFDRDKVHVSYIDWRGRILQALRTQDPVLIIDPLMNFVDSYPEVLDVILSFNHATLQEMLVPRVYELLRKENKDARAYAILLLSKEDTEMAVLSLIRALHDEEMAIRFLALLALMGKGDSRVTPAFQELLSDEHRLMQLLAAYALNGYREKPPTIVLTGAWRERRDFSKHLRLFFKESSKCLVTYSVIMMLYDPGEMLCVTALNYMRTFPLKSDDDIFYIQAALSHLKQSSNQKIRLSAFELVAFLATMDRSGHIQVQ